MTDLLLLARQVLVELRDQHDSTITADSSGSADSSALSDRDVTDAGRVPNRRENEDSPALTAASAKPESVSYADSKRRWASRWPNKPYEMLDQETGRWALETVNRAGTRIVRVDAADALAVWPERRDDDLALALRLLRLDHLELFSRDDPAIARALLTQYGPSASNKRPKAATETRTGT